MRNKKILIGAGLAFLLSNHRGFISLPELLPGTRSDRRPYPNNDRGFNGKRKKGRS